MNASAFYDSLAEHYHLIYRDWRATITQQRGVLAPLLARHLPAGIPPAETPLLDCAAGIGTQSIGLWELGYAVTAADQSARSLEVLQRHRAALGRPLRPGGGLTTQVADFLHLRQSFAPEAFAAVICLDNAVAHCPTPRALTLALASMAGAVRPGGFLLLSVRPYDALLAERPTLYPPAPAFYEGRLYFQVWRWLAEERYRARFFLLLPDEELLSWTTELRAIRMAELLAACRAAGLRPEVLLPEESGFFQPLILARKAGGPS